MGNVSQLSWIGPNMVDRRTYVETLGIGIIIGIALVCGLAYGVVRLRKYLNKP